MVNVTRDATSKALAEANFSAERVRKITETVLSAAIEASEELGSQLSETASAAAEGVRQGLTDSVEHTRESVAKAGKGVKEYAAEQLEQTKEDLDVVGEQFVETLRNVADKSGKVAQDTLHELADDAKNAGSSLREKALAASTAATAKLKELGHDALDKTEETTSKAVHALSEETKAVGGRMLAIAKGATTGMWEGAKSAFHKNDNKG